jgi:hypothetical protein
MIVDKVVERSEEVHPLRGDSDGPFFATIGDYLYMTVVYITYQIFIGKTVDAVGGEIVRRQVPVFDMTVFCSCTLFEIITSYLTVVWFIPTGFKEIRYHLF